ncbi:hypothetical protein AM493_06200 [Flavobacterium akiainvivens]|uniref:Cytochrome C551 n=1 Tax=Flavobacterium akiainvivens TaxID=1202724 RepID=A0A0M9VHK9_9FLAO|nr:hypothetical protein [Flavobacterium akiainvivens]KOS05669.1 hypothetical protein AM493_06200 [Flavobacterium akiainvivens]SFQ36389.1 hypothetical protein SAMN05444144_103278 [Flavobacterium akiainvivens]
MKKTINTIKVATAAFALVLSLASCKGEGKAGSGNDTISNTTDTVPEEGMSSRPLGDTIVQKDGDTIISTKADAPNQNPTGEQVP